MGLELGSGWVCGGRGRVGVRARVRGRDMPSSEKIVMMRTRRMTMLLGVITR